MIPNGTITHMPMNSKVLHKFLKESAERYPDKPAVSFRDTQLTYNELDSLSSQLSFCLIKKGVKAGERIGIFIEKSIESVTAVFGILQSGACYVPLDPIAPVERQVLIANDCSLKYLIASSKKLPQITQMLPRLKTLEYVFVLDCSRTECKNHVSGVTMVFKDDIHEYRNDIIEKSSLHVTENDLAYILYTSGSTGQPKGVKLSHKAAIAFVDWAWKTFNIRSDDIVSSHAPLHFDLSIFDIFVSIMAGATICLVPHGLSSFPKSVVDFIENKKISIWYSVPSILTQLVLFGNLEKRKLSSLRQILFAGEVFPSKYLRRLMELIPHASYYNLYGPTETNVITYYHVANPPETDKTIPIGALCDGVKGYIVDESGALVKKKGIGELYVACPTLMDGYWNDLRKTESVLFQNSFVPSSQEIIYKTGDLVSWNKQGSLEYHGRCDAMIKSRGYRIELGEIETVLSSHPGIKEAAVTAIADDKIGNKIKAVIVLKNKGEIAENEIKGFCSKKLPHYMIPEIISVAEAIPRTSTGKIDRKNLAKYGE